MSAPTVCGVYVDRGERDWDAHGSFYRHWTEPCGAPVHRHGRCAQHHRAHIQSLEIRIEIAESTIVNARKELAYMRDQQTCSGEANASCGGAQ